MHYRLCLLLVLSLIIDSMIPLERAHAEGDTTGEVIDINETRRWLPNIPTTDPHYNDAVRCLTNLDQKLRQLIDEGNRAATEANATSTTGPQSLDRVIRQQADLSMLKVARAFLRLREQMQRQIGGKSIDDYSASERATKAVGRLRTSSRSDSATAGIDARLVEGIKGSRSSDTVANTLFEFYDYVQTRPADGATERPNPFQDATKRHDLLRSLQLYSYKQEPDSGGRDQRYELKDRDIYVVDQLFNFYRPRNAPTSGDGNFMDNIMNKMVEQFRGGRETESSDFNAIDRQIKARYDEHKGGGSGASRYEGNSDENYTIARDRFRDYIKNEMRKFIKKQPPYAGTDHGCDHFYNNNGELKAAYRDRMCGPARAIDDILSNRIIDDFTPLYNFLRPRGSPPLNLSQGGGDFNPEMHAKRMYHNLMSCRIQRNPTTGNWEACLQLYIEHGQSTETETNWFINTGQEINYTRTSGDNFRINCNRGGRNYAYQTNPANSAYTAGTPNCISTPLHMNNQPHDHVHSPSSASSSSPNGCREGAPRSGQLWVNLGDTYQPSVRIIGTQGSVTRPNGEGNPTGPHGETIRPSTGGGSGPSWRNTSNPPRGDEVFNFRNLPLDGCVGESFNAYKAATAPNPTNPSERMQIAIVDTRSTERNFAFKARVIVPENPNPRKGTYRWQCADAAEGEALKTGRYTDPTAGVAENEEPCDQRTTSEDSGVRSMFASDIKEFAVYPRLLRSYTIKVKYFSTVQAPTDSEKIAVIPQYVSFQMRLTADPGNPGRSIMRMVPVNMAGEVIENFFTEELPPAPGADAPAPSTPAEIRAAGLRMARAELNTLVSSGAITVPGCGTPRDHSIPDDTCTDLNAVASAPNYERLFLQGVPIRTPGTATPYGIQAVWTEAGSGVSLTGGPSAARTLRPKDSGRLPVDPDPYGLSVAKGTETPESVPCTPTLRKPESDARAAERLIWVCSAPAPLSTSGASVTCPTVESGPTDTLDPNLRATSGTATNFPRRNSDYTVTAYTYTTRNGGSEILRSNTCNIPAAEGFRMNVTIDPVDQPNPLMARFRVRFSLPDGAERAFPGERKIACPNAPETTSTAGCRAENGSTVSDNETTIDLPVPSTGSGYKIRAKYIYATASLNDNVWVEANITPLSLGLGWAPLEDEFAVEGEQKVKAIITGVPTGKTLPAEQITRFVYHTDKTPAPTPPGSADVDKRAAINEPVSYKQFNAADGGAYEVQARATINGQELSASKTIQALDMRITVTARQITPSPRETFKAQARATVRPATAVIPTGAVLKWFCDGAGKPANCDKNVNVTGDGSDDFPRDTQNRSYTITAKLMPAEGTTPLAVSSALTVDPVAPVAAETFTISCDDSKTAREDTASLRAKVKRAGADYTLVSGETIRWSWREGSTDKTANGASTSINRSDSDITVTTKFFQGETERASGTCDVEKKDNCRRREPGPLGRCLDEEQPEEPAPIVLPDVAPNGAAPPQFQPIILPRSPGMFLLPGFR